MSGGVAAIIPAAGAGARLADPAEPAPVPKALRDLRGRSLLVRSAAALAPYVDQIVVALPPDVSPDTLAEVTVEYRTRIDTVDGGATRQESVRRALGGLDPAARWVLVHDAARPLVPASVVLRVLAALEAGAEAVVPAIASPDSLRHVDDGGGTTAAVPRESIRLVQTPQGFTVDALRRGHALATHDLATDDATLVELSGVAVVVVAGDPLAFKITTALDLALAETVLGGEVRA